MPNSSSADVLEALSEATSLSCYGLDSVEDFLERYFYRKLLYPDGGPVDIGSALTVQGIDSGPVKVSEYGYAPKGAIVLRGTDADGRTVKVTYPPNGTALYAPTLGLDGDPVIEGETVFDILTADGYRVDSISRSDGDPMVSLFPITGDRGIPLVVVGTQRLVHAYPLHDSEGELIVRGEKVYDVQGNGPFTVDSIQNEPRPMVGLIDASQEHPRRFYLKPNEVVHRHDVIDIDAAVIERDDTVYLLDSVEPATVIAVNEEHVTIRFANDAVRSVAPSRITHVRPILDAHGVRIARFDRVWLTDDRFIDVPAAKVVEVESDDRIVLRRRGVDGLIVATADRITHVRPMTQSRIEANVHGLIDGLTAQLDEKELDTLRDGMVSALAQQRDIDAAARTLPVDSPGGKGISIIEEPPTRIGRFIERSRLRMEAWGRKLEERKGMVHVRHI